MAAQLVASQVVLSSTELVSVMKFVFQSEKNTAETLCKVNNK
jgi:hypothetical protein